MKRSATGFAGGLIGLALCACSSPLVIGESASAAAVPDTPPAPANAAPVNFEEAAKTGEALRQFTYSWPSEVSAIPALSALLTERREKIRAEQKKEWSQAVAEFGTEGCVSCTQRALETNWDVFADTKRYLSLSSTTYIYGGGAHGNTYSGGLVWDREGGAELRAADMFESPEYLQQALQPRYCEALNVERAERRGAPVAKNSTDSFEACPDIGELTVLLGSSDGKWFDRITLIADAYVAGPYVEGPYEVTLGVDRQVLGVLKPDAIKYFQLGG